MLCSTASPTVVKKLTRGFQEFVKLQGKQTNGSMFHFCSLSVKCITSKPQRASSLCALPYPSTQPINHPYSFSAHNYEAGSMHTVYLYEAHSNASHCIHTCISIKVGKTETNHEVQLHIKTQSHPSNNMNELAHRAFDFKGNA